MTEGIAQRLGTQDTEERMRHFFAAELPDIYRRLAEVERKARVAAIDEQVRLFPGDTGELAPHFGEEGETDGTPPPARA